MSDLAMRAASGLASLLLLLPCAAFAQDERRVTSPDGRLEFRIFVTSQADTTMPRLAYQVMEEGRTLVGTSLLGFDLLEQEPLLGENAGLVSSKQSSGAGFNSLYTHYMQNGSLGRYLDVEARAYNAGIAFRFVIPHSTPVERLLIAAETTEFGVPHAPAAELSVPFEADRLTVTEIPVPGYPKMALTSQDHGTYAVVRLSGSTTIPHAVYDGRPPFTSPWRIILTGPKPRTLAALPGL